MKRYFFYRCTKTKRFYLPDCPIKQVSATRLTKEIANNFERILLDEMYIKNFVLGLNFEAMQNPQNFKIFKNDTFRKSSENSNRITGIELGEITNIESQKSKSQKSVIGSLAVIEPSKSRTFFDENLVAILFKEVLELCKKKEEKI